MRCAGIHSVAINFSLTRFESAKLLKRIIFWLRESGDILGHEDLRPRPHPEITAAFGVMFGLGHYCASHGFGGLELRRLSPIRR